VDLYLAPLAICLRTLRLASSPDRSVQAGVYLLQAFGGVDLGYHFRTQQQEPWSAELACDFSDLAELPTALAVPQATRAILAGMEQRINRFRLAIEPARKSSIVRGDWLRLLAAIHNQPTLMISERLPNGVVPDRLRPYLPLARGRLIELGYAPRLAAEPVRVPQASDVVTVLRALDQVGRLADSMDLNVQATITTRTVTIPVLETGGISHEVSDASHASQTGPMAI